MKWELFSKKWPRRDKRGFSLIEVALSLAITSFAILSLVSLMAISMRSITESKTDSVSVFIADSLRARMIADPYWPWTEGSISGVRFPESLTFLYDEEGLEVPDASEAVFQAEVTFQNSPHYPSKRLDYITIDITPVFSPGLSPASFVVQRAHEEERGE